MHADDAPSAELLEALRRRRGPGPSRRERICIGLILLFGGAQFAWWLYSMWLSI